MISDFGSGRLLALSCLSLAWHLRFCGMINIHEHDGGGTLLPVVKAHLQVPHNAAEQSMVFVRGFSVQRCSSLGMKVLIWSARKCKVVTFPKGQLY